MTFPSPQDRASAPGAALDFRQRLAARSRALQAVRRFFTERGFCEVETPVRIPMPAPEVHIDAEPSGARYLRTSPELQMKCLLAEGSGNIFQMGACFRHGERGRLHNPEYTMLEWYRTGADYAAVRADAQSLVHAVACETAGRAVLSAGDTVVDLDAEPCVLRVEEAFERFAGWNPVSRFDADRFDADMVSRVEPSLPRDRLVFLTDYPSPAAAMARLKPDRPEVAERWELYAAGIELANAFTELTDPEEQQRRFAEWGEQRRTLGKDAYGTDERFMDAMQRGLPTCAGVALGIDRLIMLVTGETCIGRVRFGE